MNGLEYDRDEYMTVSMAEKIQTLRSNNGGRCRAGPSFQNVKKSLMSIKEGTIGLS